MDREQAEAEQARLAAEHPEATWMVRERDGAWEVLRVGIKPPDDPVGAHTESKPKPPQPDDPRSALRRNVGPPYG